MHTFFFIRTDGKYIKINFRDIIFVEGRRNYIKVITGKRSYLILITMKRMEEILPASMFIRIHKSYIVSLEHVTEFERETVYLKDRSLPVGNQYRGVIERSVLIAQEVQHNSLLTIPISYIGQKVYAG